jgi:hypothetical protein
MGYVRLKRGNGYLAYDGSDDQRVTLVGHFLTDDVHKGGGHRWIEFILDDKYQECTSNYTFLEKEDGNIILGCLFEDDPYDRALTVPIVVMIDLLEQWDVVCATNPDEVIVIYDGEKFTVEGKKAKADLI